MTRGCTGKDADTGERHRGEERSGEGADDGGQRRRKGAARGEGGGQDAQEGRRGRCAQEGPRQRLRQRRGAAMTVARLPVAAAVVPARRHQKRGAEPTSLPGKEGSCPRRCRGKRRVREGAWARSEDDGAVA
jgi:hypothetical protein